jgi:NADPH-dependent ferric siderophore reductase
MVMTEQKPRRPQYAFDVVATEPLTPHMIRIWFGGNDFDAFVRDADERGSTDTYVKMLFARPELGLVPPYDLEALRETLAPEDMPSRRTYTIRQIDRRARAIAIDFVMHGDSGVAGPWAQHARLGDTVVISSPGGGYAPSEEVDEHLFIGDESALPAIAASIESLPATARGRAYIEVDSDDDEMEIGAPEGVELHWLHRRGATHGTAMVDAIEALEPPRGSVDVFAHGERAAMKRLRSLIHNQWGIPRSRMSYSAYWALGREHDAFQAEKRTPIGQIFEEEPATPPTWRA